MKLSASERELCEAAGIDQEVFALVRQVAPGAKIRQLNVIVPAQDGESEPGMEEFEPGAGLSIRARDEESAEAWASELAEKLPEGYLALCSEDSDADQDEVALLQTVDAYELLRVKGTNGHRFGLATSDIIARLQQWDREFGISLVGAGYDWVEFHFESLPSELDPVVAQLSGFCPDLLEQGFDTLQEVLAEYEGEQVPEELEPFVDIDWTLPDAGALALKRSLEVGDSIFLFWD